jgi:hypothetical protein
MAARVDKRPTLGNAYHFVFYFMLFLTAKSIINNRSLHKMNIDWKKQNYKTDVSYISGTPMKKVKNKPNLLEVRF